MRVFRLNTPKALSALRPLKLSRKAKHRLVVEVHSRATAQAAAGLLETLLARIPFPVKAILSPPLRQAQGKL
jgi:hypothetical protein